MPIPLLSPKKRKQQDRLNPPKENGSTTSSLTPPVKNGGRSWTPPPPTLNTSSVRTPDNGSPYEYSSPGSPLVGQASSIYRSDASSIYSAVPKRTLSDKVKTSPSSLVRQSWHVSSPSSSENTLGHHHLNANTMLLQNKAVTESLPRELSPVVNLIMAHKLTVYALGSFEVPAIDDSGQKVWAQVDAKLTGSELAIWRSSKEDIVLGGSDEHKPNYINLVDSTIELLGQRQIKISQDYKKDHSMLISFFSHDDYVKWISAMELAKFEFDSLNEAYTAVMLSLKASKFSDVHILLNPKKRFPKFEWCNLRLPQASAKWLKVYVAIIPCQSKKKGRVEIYASDKVSKKNLIMYIPDAFSVFNVYPESASMIDFNSILKLNGDVYINKGYEHLFYLNDGNSPGVHHTHTSRSLSMKLHKKENSASSLSPSRSGRSRAVSTSSTSSFFSSASSPAPTSKKSPKSVSSFIEKNLDHFVYTNYVYLMPITHPSVPGIETMIRNFIPIVDAFKLYGRPKHLTSDKQNQESMLFGLPSLPHHHYLSVENTEAMVSSNLRLAESNNWDAHQWRHVFKDEVSRLLRSGNYKGVGDVTVLYSNLDLNMAEISSPRISFPRAESPYSPVPHSSYEFENISDSPLSSNNDYKIQSGGALGEPIDLGHGSDRSPRSMNSGDETPNLDKPLPQLQTNEAVDDHPYNHIVKLNLNDG